jgi:hypothetical protein
MAVEYPPREVLACRMAMIEVFTILGEYREQLALVGGWIPPLLVPESAKLHTGSLDIDLAVDTNRVGDDAYQTIRGALIRRGYQQGDQPFQFIRFVPVDGGGPVRVKVDFLAGEYGGTGDRHRTQPVQDIGARKARGCDLVFDHTVTVRISGLMQDGARNEVPIKIAGPIPFLVMKGMALWNRMNPKDAYDIYWLVRYYPGGIAALTAEFTPNLNRALVIEGLAKIRSKFLTVDAIGPVWAAQVQSPSADEPTQIARDAFERVNALLDRIHIEPFEG